MECLGEGCGNPADDGQIVAKSNSASGWQFKTSPDTGPHTFGVAVAGATNTYAQRYSTTVRLLNVWYHVAGVYDATARTLDIYVNGVRDNGALSRHHPSVPNKFFGKCEYWAANRWFLF